MDYHQHLLVVFNGTGGYSINPSAVDFVCENTEYSDPLRLAGLIEIVISNQMKIWNQKKEEGEDSAK